MSEFVVAKTCIKDKDMLIEALIELGVPLEHIQVNETATSLEGYVGDRRKQTAEIIVPRKYVGTSSNDVGWKIQQDGTYSFIISEFDKRNSFWRKMIPQSAGGTGDLLKIYSKNVIKKTAAKAYHRVGRCEFKKNVLEIEVTV
jgi:hypothetical protein